MSTAGAPDPVPRTAPSPADGDGLRQETRDGVRHLVLARPERRNALDGALSGELDAAVEAAEVDGAVGALLVRADGPAFCAGGDLAELARADEPTLRAVYRGFLRVARSTLPSVAAIGGAAVGAGLNLALCCDVRVASPAARLRCGFAELALHPGGGHAHMLERLVGREATAALLLCGETLDGEEAARRGLVWRCVADADLLDVAHGLAARAAAVPAALREDLLETVREARGHGWHADAVERELQRQLDSLARPEAARRLAAARDGAARPRSSRA